MSLDTIVEDIREEARARAEEIRTGGESRADETVRVHGHEDDTELLETIVDDFEGFAVGDPVDCLGGVVVESDESRVQVNNTFDSVLEEVWEDNLGEISARLFEE